MIIGNKLFIFLWISIFIIVTILHFSEVFHSPVSKINTFTKSLESYSHFRCIHPDGQRSCLFRDVCIVNTSLYGGSLPFHLRYFEDPTILPEPILDGHGTFSKTFVGIRKNAGEDEFKWLPIITIRNPIPELTFWYPVSYVSMFYNFYSDNFGHALGDDMFPVYVAFKDFNILEYLSETQVILAGDMVHIIN